jgi:outer membrane lipoprotein
MKKFFILVMVAALLSGCAHVISRSTLTEVDRSITFPALLKNPNAYIGKVVLLGGVIVSTINKEDGTLLEVYATNLDRQGRPVHVDRSEGRFLALYQGFLDSEIYKQGRKVVIAGVVQGEKVQKLDEIQYRYPYLIVKEIHLLKEPEYSYYDQYGPYPYPYYGYGPWYNPWYPWGPWWGGPGVVIVPGHRRHFHH